MNTQHECLPCLVRQAVDASRLACPDPVDRELVLRDILGRIGQADLRLPPPALGQLIHRRLRETTGAADVHEPAKRRLNALAISLLPELEARVAASDDPFATAVRLAIAGNVIDLGPRGDIDACDVRRAIEEAVTEPLIGPLDELRTAARTAARILYLADNAGELVFDRLLIEQLSPARVTVAVRGAAVLNDATTADARAAGLHDLVEVIENGSDAPGTILDDCCPEFRRRFADANVVIAKGQGNFECLVDGGSGAFILFRVKCPVIGARTGFPVGSQVVVRAAGRNVPAGERAAPALPASRPASRPQTAGALPNREPRPASIAFTPIGVIRSEHGDPAQTPIQPVYARGCRGTAVVLPEYADGLRDLEGFSHAYLVYHLDRAEPARLLVKPFLQDVERGVFATRAPCRPNPIGLSIVKVLGREGNVVELDDVDVLDGTPLLDIKPYAARFDHVETTRNGWQDEVDEETSRERGTRGRSWSPRTP